MFIFLDFLSNKFSDIINVCQKNMIIIQHLTRQGVTLYKKKIEINTGWNGGLWCLMPLSTIF